MHDLRSNLVDFLKSDHQIGTLLEIISYQVRASISEQFTKGNVIAKIIFAEKNLKNDHGMNVSEKLVTRCTSLKKPLAGQQYPLRPIAR